MLYIRESVTKRELDRWIEQSNDGIFKNTWRCWYGKINISTLFKMGKNDIEWHILDLKKAIREIKIYGSSINIPHEHFVSLYGKVLSAVILEIQKSTVRKNKRCRCCYSKAERTCKNFYTAMIHELLGNFH